MVEDLGEARTEGAVGAVGEAVKGGGVMGFDQVRDCGGR